jgi:glycosyltransferase involved in cell wall biosynthesis
MKSSVDVIIPTYNGLPYLKEAVKSVLSQTHHELLLHIVDDGSTDQTDRYVKTLTDKRIRYHRKPNGGLSSARNYGIGQATADYVAFLDADDVWRPLKLEKQLALMQDHPMTGLVYGYQEKIDSQGKVRGVVRDGKRGQLFDWLLTGNFITGSGSMVLIRRKVFDDVGLFREDFKIGEDWEMWLRIARKYEIDFVPDYLAAIRVHPGGMQADHKKMADGLSYMFPVMVEEFGLKGRRRAALAEACLVDAVHNYYLAYDHERSLEVLADLIRVHPATLLRATLWPRHLKVLVGRHNLHRFKRALRLGAR